MNNLCVLLLIITHHLINIEDIKPFMESHGFETLNLIGSTNIGAALSPEQWKYWKNSGEHEFTQLIDLLKETATNPYVLGYQLICFTLGEKNDNLFVKHMSSNTISRWIDFIYFSR
ncbi:hypothetical protein [Saccharococcus caldoxylosilyticus]|uniref:hypothetical protein n=1 Tax=Saccharococcus caldoxylosilyticus TaxID=81408 RepID=UPI0012FD9C19|nr:hypothetical protein [Parageobacillus caldoxylosilyticus]